jgi:hypothetical protein
VGSKILIVAGKESHHSILDFGASVNILSKELYDSYQPRIRETSECMGKSTPGSAHASCNLSRSASMQSSLSDTTGAGPGTVSRGDSSDSTQSSVDASHVSGTENLRLTFRKSSSTLVSVF